MRLLKRLQLALREEKIKFDTGDELEEIDRILRSASGVGEVYEAVLADVTGKASSKTGREGQSAERIVRLGILRKRLGLTYRGLSEATADSLSVRRFLDLKPGERLKRSAIHGNLKAVIESTWAKLNECITGYAVEAGYEDAKSIRGDTTTVETNIHYPTDASLLADSARVLNRSMRRAREIVGSAVEFVDHSRRAKKKLYRINNARTEERRHPEYLEFIRFTRETIADAERVVLLLPLCQCADAHALLTLMACESELNTFIPRAKQALDQAYRRIVKGESVPAAEKIVSIFEPHTDIIVKGFRDVVFGHKVCLTTGKSGLVLGFTVLDGNPKDSTLVPAIIDEHKRRYGEAPQEAAFDGCFASHANRDLLKQAGVEELTFSKNLNMPLDSLVSSKRVHRLLLRFRAGIEGCISFLKRVFSFSRVLDRSKETFHAALQLGALTYNLTLLARFNIARQQL